MVAASSGCLDSAWLVLEINEMKRSSSDCFFPFSMGIGGIGIPAAAMLLLCVIPLDSEAKLCILVYLSCPCATLTTIYSIQTNTRPELCARAVLFSTIAFAASLPFVIAVGQSLFFR